MRIYVCSAIYVGYVVRLSIKKNTLQFLYAHSCDQHLIAVVRKISKVIAKDESSFAFCQASKTTLTNEQILMYNFSKNIPKIVEAFQIW